VATVVADNPALQRFEAKVDGELAGWATYRRSCKQGLIAFMHTEVEDEFSGQGIGGQLAREALDAARAEGLAVLPFCPFVNSFIAEHPEYVDLVPEGQREEFGL
jgi:predicted GNAT family acetyltransferase